MVSVSDFCKNPSKYPNLPLTQVGFYLELCGVSKAFQGFNFGNFAGMGIDFLVHLLTGLLTSGSAWINLLGIIAINKAVTLEIVGEIMESAKFFFAAGEGTYLKLIGETGVLKCALNAGFWLGSIFSAIGRLPVIGTGLKWLFRSIQGLSKFASETVVYVSEAGVEKTIGDLAGALTKGLSSILMFIEIGGMIIDLWDPCGFNKMINNDTINLFTSSTNKAYRSAVLTTVAATQLEDGSYIQLALWPIDYPPQIFDLSNAYFFWQTHLFGTNYDAAINMSVEQSANYAMYLNSLTYNSLGQVLCFPKNEDSKTIHLGLFDRVSGSVISSLSGDNLKIRQLLTRWSPLIYFLLLLVAVVVIFIKL